MIQACRVSDRLCSSRTRRGRKGGLRRSTRLLPGYVKSDLISKVIECGLLRPTVSATEIVSLRSFRRVAISWTICRSSEGGKLNDDMVRVD